MDQPCNRYLPALALGLENGVKDIMLKKHVPIKAFRRRDCRNIFYRDTPRRHHASRFLPRPALVSGSKRSPYYHAFATLGLIQITHAFNVRSQINPSSVRYFLQPLLIGQLWFPSFFRSLSSPCHFLNDIFRVFQLNPAQWLIVIISSLLIIPLVEGAKFFIPEKDE
jgi:Ca2+-transporting ATPase